jgi:hypothetical protein
LELVVRRAGQEKALSLSHAGKFSVFKPEAICLVAGDQIRITKNFQSRGKKFRNNELHTVTALADGKLVLGESEIALKGAVHIDQGVAITSHAAQGKTVDQVIVSVPIDSFSQANEAQFYVSMSRARQAMHLFTDSKAALTHFNPEQSALLIHCTAGTVIVSGPQAVDFYERFCSHRVAWLKADGKDILSITLALHDK